MLSAVMASIIGSVLGPPYTAEMSLPKSAKAVERKTITWKAPLFSSVLGSVFWSVSTMTTVASLVAPITASNVRAEERRCRLPASARASESTTLNTYDDWSGESKMYAVTDLLFSPGSNVTVSSIFT